MNDAQRGEVWLVDLGLAAKVRPCLVLSVPLQNQDRALLTLSAHTTSARGSRFEVHVKTKFLQPGVFDAQKPGHGSKSQTHQETGNAAGSSALLR